jgi:hypothetical protein
MGAWRTIGVGLVLLGICAVPSARGGDERAARAGMEAHVDPQSGRFVPEPVVPPPSRPVVPAPLPAPEVPAPGGGMMVHLNGRFLSHLVATVDDDGHVHLDCVTGDAPHVHQAGE